MLKTKSSSWIFSDKYPGGVELRSNVLKPIETHNDFSCFLAFEILNFIMLKMISRGYEDYERLSAALSKSEDAACLSFQQVTRSRNLQLFMLKMISSGYE